MVIGLKIKGEVKGARRIQGHVWDVETFKVFFSAGKLALPGCSGSGRLQGGLACQIPQTMFPHHISSFPGRSSASLGCHEAHLAAPQGGAVPNANPDLCQVGRGASKASVQPSGLAPLPSPGLRS